MNKLKQLLGTAVLAIGLTSAPGWAATLIISGGQLVGASGVSVAGSLYDVSFEEGTCVAIFDGCDEASDFTFQSAALASLASQALLDNVLIDVSGFNVDSRPELQAGVTSSVVSVTVTPYAIYTSHGRLLSYVATNWKANPNEDDYVRQVQWLTPSYDVALANGTTFARWTPVAVVPLPAGGLLLLSALGGIAALRRRKKRRA